MSAGKKEEERGKVKQDGCKVCGCSSAAWKARRNNCVKVQAREERKGRRDCANVDDSCTTDDQRKNLPT